MAPSTPGFLTRARLKLLGSRTPFKPPEIRQLNKGFLVLRQTPIIDHTDPLFESMFNGRSATVQSIFDVDVKSSNAVEIIDVTLSIAPVRAPPSSQRHSTAAYSSSAIYRSSGVLSPVVGQTSPSPLNLPTDERQQRSALVESAAPQIFSDSLALQMPRIEGESVRRID